MTTYILVGQNHIIGPIRWMEDAPHLIDLCNPNTVHPPSKPMAKYVIIGVLWYLWHLSFLKGGSVQENLFFMGLLILGSWGIGQIAEATKSIVASACFHLIVQIMSFNALF